MNDAIADAIVKDVARQLAEYGDEAEHFKLRVAARTMEEVHFRMKFITRLGKMKQYYADRNKVSIDSFRLFYMGELISDDDTPVTLGMKDGDEVEVSVKISLTEHFGQMKSLDSLIFLESLVAGFPGTFIRIGAH